MSDTKKLQEVAARWMNSYNSVNSFTEEKFDFELEQLLHSSSPDFLIALVNELSQRNLSSHAIAFLGAGIAEELLLKDASVLEKIVALSRKQSNFREVFSYAWEREEMPPAAIAFLKSVH